MLALNFRLKGWFTFLTGSVKPISNLCQLFLHNNTITASETIEGNGMIDTESDILGYLASWLYSQIYLAL